MSDDAPPLDMGAFGGSLIDRAKRVTGAPPAAAPRQAPRQVQESAPAPARVAPPIMAAGPLLDPNALPMSAKYNVKAIGHVVQRKVVAEHCEKNGIQKPKVVEGDAEGHVLPPVRSATGGRVQQGQVKKPATLQATPKSGKMTLAQLAESRGIAMNAPQVSEDDDEEVSHGGANEAMAMVDGGGDGIGYDPGAVLHRKGLPESVQNQPVEKDQGNSPRMAAAVLGGMKPRRSM